jgi:hypothetical protein
VFNKIIKVSFPNPENNTTIQVQANKQTRHIILKTLSGHNKERTLKAVKEKQQVKYKGKFITSDFSTETLIARRKWNNVFQLLKENCQPRLSIQQKYYSQL